MTRYESIDPDKVKEIFTRFFAVDKRTGEIKTCCGLDCVNCLFYSADSDDPCCERRMKWLDQSAFDPEKDIDWSKVPVDTPVIVWNKDGEYIKGHFLKKMIIILYLLVAKRLIQVKLNLVWDIIIVN